MVLPSDELVSSSCRDADTDTQVRNKVSEIQIHFSFYCLGKEALIMAKAELLELVQNVQQKKGLGLGIKYYLRCFSLIVIDIITIWNIMYHPHEH